MAIKPHPLLGHMQRPEITVGVLESAPIQPE